jgi:hypothetical protein
VALRGLAAATSTRRASSSRCWRPARAPAQRALVALFRAPCAAVVTPPEWVVQNLSLLNSAVQCNAELPIRERLSCATESSLNEPEFLMKHKRHN